MLFLGSFISFVLEELLFFFKKILGRKWLVSEINVNSDGGIQKFSVKFIGLIVKAIDKDDF